MPKFSPLAALAFAAALCGPAVAATAGDPVAGQKKAAMCIGCHGIVGYQSSFPQVHKVPKISGQGAGYIQASLVAYQKGDRKHPTMRAIAGSLTEQDIADLAAFYAGHQAPTAPATAKIPPTPPAIQALLTRGNCQSCHGESFNKPLDAAYPKIAGQHADYLYVALKSYQAQTPVIGRNNAIMVPQVQTFKPQELRALAEYIASLPSELTVAEEPRLR